MKTNTNQQIQTIDVAALIVTMRTAGRTELIHYAGAAHRDIVAWHMCAEYIAAPTASESELKSQALLAAHGWVVTPAQIDAARASYAA